jgi:hypothetical protein
MEALSLRLQLPRHSTVRTSTGWPAAARRVSSASLSPARGCASEPLASRHEMQTTIVVPASVMLAAGSV